MNNNKYFETIRVSDGCGRCHDEEQPKHICETCKYGPKECAKSDTVCYSGKINWRCWEPKFDNEELYETVTKWTEVCGGHCYKEKQLKHICKTCAEGPSKCILYRDNHTCWIDPFSEYNMSKPHVVDLKTAEEETQKDLIKYGLMDCLDQEISNIEEPLESVPTEPLVFKKGEPWKEDEAKTKWRFDKMVDVDANTTDEELAKKIVDSVLEHIDDKNAFYTRSKQSRVNDLEAQINELQAQINTLSAQREDIIKTITPIESLKYKYSEVVDDMLSNINYNQLIKLYDLFRNTLVAAAPEDQVRIIKEDFLKCYNTLYSSLYKSINSHSEAITKTLNYMDYLDFGLTFEAGPDKSIKEAFEDLTLTVKCSLKAIPIDLESSSSK